MQFFLLFKASGTLGDSWKTLNSAQYGSNAGGGGGGKSGGGKAKAKAKAKGAGKKGLPGGKGGPFKKRR